ncbi:MAG: hypothetical protein GEU75_06680 [Dehalococcoidia bacterium]|nr:hypothetical protein [Dehalococcoidia bacterium]
MRLWTNRSLSRIGLLAVSVIAIVSLLQVTRAEESGYVAVAPAVCDAAPPTPVVEKNVVRQNPTTGMTPDEITEYHNQARQDFAMRYREWLAGFAQSGVDVRCLEPSESMADYRGPAHGDLASALTAADVVVLGTVESLRYEEFRTLAKLRIDVLLKGDGYRGATLEFWTPGGPFPRQDYGYASAFLAYHPPVPPLLPGDRALLLLEYEPQTDGLWVQPYSGEYLLSSGRVMAIEASDFGRSLNGLSEKALLDLVRSQLKR